MKNLAYQHYLAIAFLGTFSINIVAGDVDVGKTKSTAHAACHGQAGVSPNTEWPNLAGQKEKYLIAQLKAFKSGDRKTALMSGQATGLFDEDIANLSAYYSSL